jgi:restriction endonuclease Mrr
MSSVMTGEKPKTRSVWSSEVSRNAAVRAVGDRRGLKAGEVAEAAAEIGGLSQRARKVKTPHGREKYRADVYNVLHRLRTTGLMRENDRGGYLLTAKGRKVYRGLVETTSAVNS